MSDVTEILTAIDQGAPARADELLPRVYEELRKLAAARMAQESPGQTLQPTALVHEAPLPPRGSAFKVLARNKLLERITGTPAIAANTLCVRTTAHIWAFGK